MPESVCRIRLPFCPFARLSCRIAVLAREVSSRGQAPGQDRKWGAAARTAVIRKLKSIKA